MVTVLAIGAIGAECAAGTILAICVVFVVEEGESFERMSVSCV